ncbi:MAG: winged helix-turn-helix domain-containing protein [Crocinitomicaceae bacterium]|nr:winged helix-turn-helix domain-containing protein [Crocinitomicaceae bacterium]
MNTIVLKFPVLLMLLFLFVGQGNAQKTKEDRHVEVSLRMIGHRFLLSYGDSTSRVLPIEKVDDRYKISFDTIFEFRSQDLVDIVNDVVEETRIASNYIVEVENCLTRKIVYSYEMQLPDTSNLIPCGLRPQPLGCYSIFFTNLDLQKNLHEVIKTEGRSYLGAKIALGALILLLGFFILKKKSKSEQREAVSNHRNIEIGRYNFDTVTLILELDESKEELTSKESDLLLLLVNHVNETVERDAILKAVWGDEGDYIGRTLDVFISKLRKRLKGDENLKIMNVRGVGYKLIINTP